MEFTLKQARDFRNLSQDDMAKHLNCTRDTYRKWENDPSKITIANAKKICSILDMPVSAIFFGEEIYKM